MADSIGQCGCSQVHTGTVSRQQELSEQDEPPIRRGRRKKLKDGQKSRGKPLLYEKNESRPLSTRNSLSVSSVSIAKILLVLIAQIPAYHAFPLVKPANAAAGHQLSADTPREPDEPAQFGVNMTVSVILVLLGGVFAGLTLGLMGQDEVYLQVMIESGDVKERKAASKVLNLLKRGKHWVLVTLLLSNVITNETLPIVLDRCLGGGWPAVVSSTVAIVIFGEIIPQSISVRYGLSVGSTFAPFVLILMYIMYPVAYPVAMLLDYILGEDHGTMYRKSGLKTLVTLHKSMGVERLNEDEVTIISAVLDLKEKPVSTIMTPMADVFVLSSNTILDETTMEKILYTGFNRIPIHVPGEPTNFVGMLLVRILITYDPEDALPVSSFPLATLPETGPDTSCLNILNYFQEGKSHMVIVSEHPGARDGAVGVLTLEDVIEELIGEEIIDESDVYVDVHKAIRRTHPGPFAKRTFLQSPRNSSGFDAISNNFRAQHLQSHNAERSGTETPLPRLEPSNNALNPRQISTKNITIKQLSGPPASRTSSQTPDLLGGTVDENVSSAAMPALSALDGPNHNRKRSTSSAGSGRTVSIDDQILGISPGHGAIFRTEAGAIKDALPVNGTVPVNVPGNIACERPVTPNGAEIHSFRTGGIIESVINVQGVNKIIIEDAFAEDIRRDHNGSGKSSRSNSGKRDGNTDEDSRPLLSDSDGFIG